MSSPYFIIMNQLIVLFKKKKTIILSKTALYESCTYITCHNMKRGKHVCRYKGGASIYII